MAHGAGRHADIPGGNAAGLRRLPACHGARFQDRQARPCPRRRLPGPHPETRAFLRWQQDAPLSTSFANDTYYSINAFRFIDDAG
jgi:hypothetical protein